jgi:hypothetical protein
VSGKKRVELFAEIVAKYAFWQKRLGYRYSDDGIGEACENLNRQSKRLVKLVIKVLGQDNFNEAVRAIELEERDNEWKRVSGMPYPRQ